MHLCTVEPSRAVNSSSVLCSSDWLVRERQLKRIGSQPGDVRHGTTAQRLLLRQRVAATSIIAVVLAFGSAGCSYQLGSLKNRGEIELKSSKVSESASLPSDADLALARAAASEMLDKGGKTASMPWENPRTGARGTVTPVASAYTQDGATCHDFLASYVRDRSTSWLQGEACRTKPGQWEVRTLKPWQKTEDKNRIR
jgi:surface antigen